MKSRRSRRVTKTAWVDLSFLPLIAVAMLVVTALGTVLRVYGLPTEARTARSWYGYESHVAFDYTVTVKPNTFYPKLQLSPHDLIRQQLPIEPPVYRRIVISKYADSIEVKVPYSFRGDRPADMKGRLYIDGQITLPGVWQKPVEWKAVKQVTSSGNELSGTETFTISLKQLLDTLDNTRKMLDIAVEPLEVKIRPTFEVEVDGLAKPVIVTNQAQHQLSVRSTTIEVDDPKESRQEKTFTEVVVRPNVISSFGWVFEVAQLRQISSIGLVVLIGLAALLILTRRRRTDDESLIAKLGPSLVAASAFELPHDVALADIRSARELVLLHTQTERPVIQVDNHYYLLDGTTCYRLSTKETEE